MKIRTDGLDSAHRDITRQQTVHLVNKLFAVERLCRIEMCHHHPSMHTGIRTAGACYGDCLFQQDRQRVFKDFLYRNTVRLDLPAVVRRPVV